MASFEDFLAPLAPNTGSFAALSTAPSAVAAVAPSQTHSSAVVEDSTENDCIFVGNLPKKYTKLQLEKIVRQLFTTYGPVEYTKASMDKKGRPYCFVKFQNPQMPKKVLSDEIVLDSRSLRVEMAKGLPVKATTAALQAPVDSACSLQQAQQTLPVQSCDSSLRTASPSPTTPPQVQSLDPSLVSVSHLNTVFVSEQLLSKYFSKYGNVVSAKLMASSGQEGMAQVKFEDAVSAQRAIFNEDGNIWLGKNLKVSVCSAGVASANSSPTNSLSSACSGSSAFPRPISPPSSTCAAAPLPFAVCVGEELGKNSGVSADFFDFAKSLQLPYHPHLSGQISSIPPGLHLMVSAGAAGVGKAQAEPLEFPSLKKSSSGAFECNDLF